MAFAWLGHIRFKQYHFFIALLASWTLVLPEYILNVSAIRYGLGTYTGAQMAAFNLATGVLCVALVSRFYLGENLSNQQLLGFFFMVVAVVLILYKPEAKDEPVEPLPSVGTSEAATADH